MKPNKIELAMKLMDKIVEAALFVIVMVMLIAGAMQIFSRYVLNSSLSWSEELMRFLYVWMTLIGTSLAVRRKQFTTIEAVYNKVCEKSAVGGKVLMIIAVVLQIGFFLVLSIYGTQLAQKNMLQASPAMGLSMGIAYLALPIGGYLGILYCLFELYDRFKKGGK